MYKLNLANKKAWLGTKLCRKKNLKSPQWLRHLKMHKRYSILRIDKIFFAENYYHNFQIKTDGGWHFGWIRHPDDIIKKINSFAHVEYNTKEYNNLGFVTECFNKNINFCRTRVGAKI